MRAIRILVLFIVLSSLLLAHRVNIFAQVEGDSITGQCYYSDGVPVRNQKIDISRLSGEKVMELETDSAGYFRFAPPVREDLKIVLYAGMGHKAETTIMASDMPEIKKLSVEKPKSKQQAAVTVPERTEIDEEQLRRVVEEVVDERFNALRALIVKQQNSISLTTIIGGIGYIFGIFGLLLFLRRKKRK
jgi:nickel transport protein